MPRQRRAPCYVCVLCCFLASACTANGRVDVEFREVEHGLSWGERRAIERISLMDDIKKLGRFRRPGYRMTKDRIRSSPGAGWEYVHDCVDDRSRGAFSRLYPDETAASSTAFLTAALAYYQRLNVRVRRVLPDNGGCYRSRVFNARCRQTGVRHIYTRPFTPRTNGKAERFIQTALREWAYAHAYDTSAQRAPHLQPWLHRYDWHRPHASLKAKPPISRIRLTGDNLLRYHS